MNNTNLNFDAKFVSGLLDSGSSTNTKVVQQFYVLKCHSCNIFQVRSGKKTRKWICIVCGMKQTVIKVFGEGTAKDCRLRVQLLNQINIPKPEFTFHLPNKNNFIPSSAGIPISNSAFTSVKNHNFLNQENISKRRSKWDSFLEIKDHENSHGVANFKSSSGDADQRCDTKKICQWDTILMLNGVEKDFKKFNLNEKEDESKCKLKKSKWDAYVDSPNSEDSVSKDSQLSNTSMLTRSREYEWDSAGCSIVKDSGSNKDFQLTTATESINNRKFKWNSFLDRPNVKNRCVSENSQFGTVTKSTDDGEYEWKPHLECNSNQNAPRSKSSWIEIDRHFRTALTIKEENDNEMNGITEKFPGNCATVTGETRSPQTIDLNNLDKFWSEIDEDINSLLNF